MRPLPAVLAAAASLAGSSGLPAASPDSAPVNLLAREKSPYLQQHAGNPVAWHPWGEAAFTRAREEGKPVFLSIGYSTCHWCHVMARESFEDPEVARALNDGFVSIKVDREERPDVDAIYMEYVQATTGRGGWPLSAWLTPSGKPFLGGTYFPRAAFLDLLAEVAHTWKEDRGRIAAAADRAEAFLKAPPPAPRDAEDGALQAAAGKAFSALLARYDGDLGGFTPAPKFPQPSVLAFLFRHEAEPRAREMALHTLRAMARGGIHDHLGGGFHRYSVDARWHVPHFEKMLCDQALLASAYLEAWQITGDDDFREVLTGILDYVLRDMTSPEGGFFTAEDADSAVSAAEPGRRREGAFYVWTRAEIAGVLGAKDSRPFSAAYDVRRDGNVEIDPFGELAAVNILHRPAPASGVAAEFNLTAPQLEARLARGRRSLLNARSLRPRPRLDDKVLAGWNGLMISAFSRAAAALDEPRYMEAARRAASFVLERLFDPARGGLLRTYRAGQGEIGAFLDDYAFVIQGLLDLYEADGEIGRLKAAIRLQEIQDRLFGDSKGGAYFATDGTDGTLIARRTQFHDGALPSGNSVAALNLLRVSRMTGDPGHSSRARRVFAAALSGLESSPEAHARLLAAARFARGGRRQIVLAAPPGDPALAVLRRAVFSAFVPDAVILRADGGEGQRFLSAQLPALALMKPVGGKAIAYVCIDYACRQPTSDPVALARQLK